MKPSELANIEFNWRFWGRPEQWLPVDTKWSIWLLLAGRGFGKTRTGCEAIRELVGTGKYGRIAIIGETASDARDVLIEGPSGILAVYPKSERPTYEPSKRRITWPNGAVASTYNATEPDQLRGPQHDLALCFVAGTQIETPRGRASIETLGVGDLVLTRKGPRRIVGTSNRIADVGAVSFSNGNALTGTFDHPVLTRDEWVNLGELVKGDIVCVKDALNGAASAGIATARGEDRITSGRTNQFGRNERSGCTSRFGATLTAIFRRGMKCITSTTTRGITNLRIWNACRKASIAPSIGGRRQFRVPIGQECPSSLSPALTAETRFYVKSQGERRYVAPAKIGVRLSGALQRELACVAASNSLATLGSFAANVVSTWRHMGRQPVFCLTVDGEPEYFANEILVHNCDELAKWQYAQETWDQLQFGMRVGDHPRQIITTTPRPIPILKKLVKRDDGSVFITKGKTSDNRSNLAASFLAEIAQRYAGTRLGRQELEAEILDDAPGALWTREIIDAARAKREMPELKQIVVAVDPSGARDEDDEGADSIGIVVAGLGVDGRGYVLSDRTLKASPAKWGQTAVGAYKGYFADRIVAERNFGGAMVQHVISTEDPNVPYREVTASRGKVIRAEPVSALYEQGRVSHVGANLADLEDQMCLLTRDGYIGKGSPDRVDALVWALTDLMVKPEPPRALF